MVVPKTAVFSEDEADYVFTAADGVIAKTKVEKGTELRNGIVITSGLASGDQVISDANQSGLKEGVKVKM